jgi:predicted PurR-regulated permease PerM
MAGTLLFGLLGATLAAPVGAVAAVTLRTLNLLRGNGLFAQRAAASGPSKAPA